MKIKSYALAAWVLSMGLASCNNEEMMNDQGTVTGKDTYMQIVISQPTVPGTYATTDPNSSEDESKLTSVDVFIYDMSANVLEVHKRLTASDFEGPTQGSGADQWKSKTSVSCKTGNKKVLAALNVSENRGSSIAAKGMGIFTDSQVDVSNYGTTDDALVDLTPTSGRGIAMFSVDAITANLVPSDDASYSTANTVTIPVQRMVAKVTMHQAENLVLEAGNGKISALAYALATTNKKTYLMRPWNAAGSGAVKDHNWANGSFLAADFYAATASSLGDADYVSVNAYASAIDYDNITSRYCPENTSEKFYQKEVTAAIVRCKFVPKDVKSGSTGGWIDEENPNYTSNTPVSFWTVSLPGGIKQYFLDKTKADDYATEEGLTPAEVVSEYTDGYCYYRVNLNPKGFARKTTIENNALVVAPSAEGAVGNYDVIRNAYYRITVSKIVAPGNPTPEPVNPEEPVEVPTDITANIDIVHWDVVDQDTELTPM